MPFIHINVLTLANKQRPLQGNHYLGKPSVKKWKQVKETRGSPPTGSYATTDRGKMTFPKSQWGLAHKSRPGAESRFFLLWPQSPPDHTVLQDKKSYYTKMTTLQWQCKPTVENAAGISDAGTEDWVNSFPSIKWGAQLALGGSKDKEINRKPTFDRATISLRKSPDVSEMISFSRSVLYTWKTKQLIWLDASCLCSQPATGSTHPLPTKPLKSRNSCGSMDVPTQRRWIL